MPNSNSPKSAVQLQVPTRIAAVKIALIYAVVGCLWIGFSGLALHRLNLGDNLTALLENVKGWFYVAVTATLLGFALDGYFKRIRRSTELLQESEERWKNALEGASLGAWEYDAQTNETYYSPSWKAMLGYKPEEIVGHLREWESRVHPEDFPGVWKEVQRHLAGETAAYTCEFRMRCKDGGYKWILSQGKVISRTPDGKPLRVSGTQSDITERKQAQKALQESEEKYRHLFESESDAIFLVDCETGRFLDANASAQRLYGYSREEMLQLHARDISAEVEKTERAIAEGAKVVPLRLCRKKDGAVFPVEITLSYLEDKGRKLFIAAIRDITERKQAERLQMLSTHVLEILNDPHKLPEATTLILDALKDALGMEAVGIRLRQDQDFPYAVAKGFSQGFLDAENHLALRNPDRTFCLDEKGNPCLECCCGMVLAGPTEASKGLLTPGGSVWTSNALEDYKLISEKDPRLNPRNRCLHEGYQSVALIPIRVKEKIIGLLQLNDRRKGRFSAELVRYLEGLAASLGVALLRMEEEHALRDSEAKWRSYMDFAPVGVLVADAEGRHTEANRAIEEMLGYGPGELIGTAVMDITAEGMKEVAAKHFADIKNKGRAEMQCRLRRKDGSSIWALVRGTLLPDGRLMGVLQDITERKRAEEALRASEARLNALYATMSEGLASHEVVYANGNAVDYIITDVNPSFESITGITRETAVGKKASQLYGVGSAPYLDVYARVAAEGKPESFETYLPSMQKHFAISVFSPGKGKFATVFSDITERKQAEEALQKQLELQDQLAKVAVTVPGTIFSFRLRPDGSTSLPFSTPTMREIFGVYPWELRDSFAPAYARIHPEDLLSVQQSIAESARTMKRWHCVFRAHHPEKGEIWIEGNSMPRLEADGSVLWHGFAQDVTERKRAEAALRESEERLRLAMEAAQMGTWECDLRTGKLFWSEAHERLLGYAPGTFQGTMDDFISMVYADDRTRMLAVGEEAKKRRSPFQVDYRVVWRDGSIHWVSSHGRYEFDAQGEAIRMMGVAFDINERKQNEERLRQLSRAVEQSPACIVITNTAGVIEYVNPKFSEVTGYSMEEVRGKNPRVLKSGEMTKEVYQRLWETILAGGVWRGEFHNKRKDGTLYWELASISPVMDGAGKITHFVAVKEDITERKRAEAALRESEAQFRSMFEVASIGMAQTDPQTGRWQRVNRKMCAITGYSMEELLQRSVVEITHPEDRQRDWELFQQVVRGEASEYRNEKRYIHKNGQAVWVNVNMTVLRDNAGNPLRTLATIEDINERIQLETQLRQAQKLEAIGQLAGGVAHDFNNIIAAIMLHLGLMRTNQNINKEAQDILKDLETGTKQAANLTRQLLMFSRRSVLAIAPLDINEVVMNFVKMLGRLIGEQIDLRFDGKLGLPAIEADAGMMEQVLMNLVVNARDALPNGGRITITTSMEKIGPQQVAANPERRAGGFVCLSVSDDGEGMDEATQKRIFEPFFTTKPAGQGTGLGLATVHGIVAQHKGWIELESAVGRGSTFRVYLPLPAQPVKIGSGNKPEPVVGGQETILLVEDDAKVRRTVLQALRLLGYQVYDTENGQEAMKVWQTHGEKVDLLLTDMVMPQGVSGLELTKRLQALKPGLLAIISSGYSAEILQAGVLDRPGVVYLPKPYDIATLAKTMRSCLDRNLKKG
jgi:nitrogen fixation negative regulator NifL